MNQEHNPIGIYRCEIAHPSHHEELIKVVPIDSVSDQEDIRITLISIELYRSGFVVIFRVQEIRALRNDHLLKLPILTTIIQDDLNTVYYPLQDTVNGVEGDWRGTLRVNPSIPVNAQKLIIVVSAVHWMVFDQSRERNLLTSEIGRDFTIML